ncbi:MAG: hypothetical protein JWP75_2552 [Frondihabitans sp.]|nr:hypothetical protein [Frondihabitans sp.]
MTGKVEFGSFLRSQREKLTPTDVGLPTGIHRRTPGLRRQEVAQLAGISVDYYIKLEQGRGATPSGQVAAAIARALMLSREERDYLIHLTGDVAPLTEGPSRSVSTAVRFLIENMPEVPAYVVDASWNVLAWNDLAVYFIGDLIRGPRSDRNLARWMFRAPADDPHWFDESSRAFAQLVASDLRSSFLRFPGDGEIELLTSELARVSARYRELSEERRPDPAPPIRKRLLIPGRGEFFFECQLLRIGDTGQQLVTYCAEQNSPVRDALRLFAAGDSSAEPLPTHFSTPVSTD